MHRLESPQSRCVIGVARGDVTPSTADGTDFGLTSVGVPFLQTFAITNPGLAPVNLTLPVTLSGDAAFTISNQPELARGLLKSALFFR